MERYMTIGVNESICPILQIYMWNMIEQIDIHKDYLQIFRLTSNKNTVIIEHEQEQPKYKNSIIVNEVTLERDLKIYIIIENDYATMMLSEEY